MSKLITLSFDVQPGGTMQVNCQYEGEGLKSFDPVQLPDLLIKVIGDLALQQAAKLAEQQVTINAQSAELAAKDANAQMLLAQLDELTPKPQEQEASPEGV